MRVLMSCIPGHGHLYPIVPLARALREAGHDVRVASSPSFCPVVERLGLPAAPVGIPWLESEPEKAFPELAGLPPHILSLALGRVITYVHPKAVVADLRSLMSEWRPDVVVVEASEWGGVLAAELEDVPWAMVTIALASGVPQVGGALFPALSPADPEERRARRELFRGSQSLGALRQELGLPPAPEPWEDQSFNRRFLTLDTAFPSLHFFTPEAAARTAHPLRPVPVSLAGAPGADRTWMENLREDVPTVHVTMGTVFFRATEILKAVVDALSTEDLDVVVSAGPLTSWDQLGPIPRNVHLAGWIDYAEFLPRCDLIVGHGGSGTMLAAFNHGVPLLMIPQGADQPVNAARVRSMGAGRFLTPGEVVPGTVRREVALLLGDPVYRLNAQRLRAEIEAMPAPEEVVGLLELLAKERRPLIASARITPAFRAVDVPLIGTPSRAGA